MDSVSLEPPSTDDEKIAEERVVMRGIPFLNARFAFWRQDAANSPIRIADPKLCLICWVDGAARFFGPSVQRNYTDIRWRLFTPPTFHEVLKTLDLSFDEAVACGFARAPTDPVTFYATLRDRWTPHFVERVRAVV